MLARIRSQVVGGQKWQIKNTLLHTRHHQYYRQFNPNLYILQHCDVWHPHRVLPVKNSEINFYSIEYFQSFEPKNTLYHNKIITFYHFEPLPPANLK